MIKITYVEKATNITESVAELKHRRYDKTLQKCREYNEDISNPIYIKSITNLNAKPRHTTYLNYKSVELKRPHIKQTKDTTILGSGGSWNNIYLIPMEEDFV